MRTPRWLGSFWGRALLLFTVSTLAGLFFATQFYFVMKAWGTPVRWDWVIAIRLWAWYEWGLLFLLVMWLGRRFPLAGPAWRRHLALHVAAGVAISVLQIVVNTWTHLTFVADPSQGFTYRGYLESLMMFAFHRNLLVYWVMIGAQHAWRTYRELQDQKLAASEMNALLAEARLQALKAQLHPHFLFNTLNTIAALLRRDPAGAERVLNDLGDLLRLALEDVTARKVPLAREAEFLDLYVKIQKARFGSRLRYESSIDADVLGALVPNLLLQPAVENAIHFAVSQRYGGGRVAVRAGRRDGRLVIEVDDDGPGLAVTVPQALESGIGLSATRARLQGLYGGGATLALERSDLGGLAVRFDLPLEAGGVDEGRERDADRERGAAA